MNQWVLVNFKSCWVFPGAPGVKPSLSNAEGPGSISGWEARISLASWPKHQNTEQYCNKFNKDIKMVHIKKKKIFEKLWREWISDLYLEILYHTWPRDNLKVSDVEKGRMLFQKCAQCHTVEKGTSPRLGQTPMLCLGEMQFRPLDSHAGAHKNKGITGKKRHGWSIQRIVCSTSLEQN